MIEKKPSSYDFDVYVDRSGLPADWSKEANCKGLDPNLFHIKRGESSDRAKAICIGCIVIKECLHYAESNSIKVGVWGGLSERQRRALRSEAYHANTKIS